MYYATKFPTVEINAPFIVSQGISRKWVRPHFHGATIRQYAGKIKNTADGRRGGTSVISQ
jgi:hypothetical protein